MTWIAEAGRWIALVLAGLGTGMLASRWNHPSGRRSLPDEWLLLSTAAAGVVAWCATAGGLLGASTTPALLATVPIDVGAGFRVAVLWATLHGASLTFGAILLVIQALSGDHGSTRTDRARFLCVASAFAFAALVMSVWFAPNSTVPTSIPPFALSAPAALAPLFALIAIVALAWTLARVIAGAPALPVLLMGAWLSATAALALEQQVRSRLAIGPRDPVVLGSAAAGLAVWLLTGALMHQRVRRFLLRGRLDVPARGNAKFVAWAAHVGGVCVAVSFALHAFASRATVTLPPGASVSVVDSYRRSWQLVNQGVSRFDAEGADVTALTVETRSPSGAQRLVAPQNLEYHGRDGQHLSGGVRESTGGPFQQMRMLLIDVDSLDAARVRVTFLPAPILWPIGIALLCLSALVALLAPRAPHQAQTPST